MFIFEKLLTTEDNLAAQKYIHGDNDAANCVLTVVDITCVLICHWVLTYCWKKVPLSKCQFYVKNYKKNNIL